MADVMDKPAAAAPARGKDTVLRLAGNRIKLGEAARQVHCAIAPMDHDPEVWLDPGYLWHRHDLMRPGDKVEITNDLHTAYAELLVVKIDRETQSIITQTITTVDWRDQPPVLTDLSSAIVERKGADKWRIILGTSILSKGHETEAEARTWLDRQKIKRERGA